MLFHRGNGSFAALKCMVNRFFNLFGGATEAVGRYCAGEGDYGTRLAFGDCQIHDPLDLEAHTELFLIWGRNPAVTNIHMMPVLKTARARGAVAVVIDPVRTKTVRYADHAVHPRPGSDGLLALGMAKVLLEQRPVDLDRLRTVGERADAYLDLVRSVSLDTAASRTDLDKKTIEWLALEYFDKKPATILQGVGLQQYTRRASDLPAHRRARHAGRQCRHPRGRRQPHQLAVARDPEPGAARRGRAHRATAHAPGVPARLRTVRRHRPASHHGAVHAVELREPDARHAGRPRRRSRAWTSRSASTSS